MERNKINLSNYGPKKGVVTNDLFPYLGSGTQE